MVKDSLAEKAYVQTKEKIIYGNLRPGDIVTVGELALQYEMSKTPVRDALNRLTSDGLLKLLPYKGYIVKQIDVKDIEDLFYLRILLEGGAAYNAALHANPQMIEKLYKLAMHDSNKYEIEEVLFMKINFDFHVAVAEASGNSRLQKLVANTMDQMLRILYLDLHSENPSVMNTGHLEPVEAIKNRNPVLAKKLAIQHIESSRARVFQKYYKF